MVVKKREEAQNPLILRCNRLIEAFAKSDDERDFYMDRLEGFLVYVDLDKSEEELHVLESELQKNKDRYCLIPKLTFYETKKIMEGFVNEKVYDIDTKEKLLDIIQSKEARENFLDFIYDHHSELEKWQVYYQERSRIRIIEWLRNNHFHFVFEEDLEIPKALVEKLKKELFATKVGKEVFAARKTLVAKAKTYYSNEALNPRPKRGRPPKQAQKTEVEQQVSTDIYISVPSVLRGFLFTPDITGPSAATFSSRFGNEEELYTNRRLGTLSEEDINQETLDQKLAALRKLSSKWVDSEGVAKAPMSKSQAGVPFSDSFDEDDEDEDFEEEVSIGRGGIKKLNGSKVAAPKQTVPKIQPKSQESKSSKAPLAKAKPPAKGKQGSPSKIKSVPQGKTASSKPSAAPAKQPAKAPVKANKTASKPQASSSKPRITQKPIPKASAQKNKPMRPIKQLKKKK